VGNRNAKRGKLHVWEERKKKTPWENKNNAAEIERNTGSLSHQRGESRIRVLKENRGVGEGIGIPDLSKKKKKGHPAALD